MTQECHLFVYGSLRPGSGHAMSRWLAARAAHCGPAWVPEALLYRVSWYPAVAPGPGRVRGDLFRLHDPVEALSGLDDFEGIRSSAADEYERRLTAVERDDGRRVMAWVYWYRLPVEHLPLVAGGDWLPS